MRSEVARGHSLVALGRIFLFETAPSTASRRAGHAAPRGRLSAQAASRRGFTGAACTPRCTPASRKVPVCRSVRVRPGLNRWRRRAVREGREALRRQVERQHALRQGVRRTPRPLPPHTARGLERPSLWPVPTPRHANLGPSRGPSRDRRQRRHARNPEACPAIAFREIR